jgi:hypothetical protein
LIGARVNLNQEISLLHHLTFGVGHICYLTVDAAGDCCGVNGGDGSQGVDINADVAFASSGGGNWCAWNRLLCCRSFCCFLVLAIKVKNNQDQKDYDDDPHPLVALARIPFFGRFWRRRGVSRRRGGRRAGRVFGANSDRRTGSSRGTRGARSIWVVARTWSVGRVRGILSQFVVPLLGLGS